MESLGKTLRGTANFTTEQDTVQDFYSEEEPMAPEESVTTEPGLKNLTFNVMEWDNDSLIKVFGGSTKQVEITVDGETYSVEKYVAPKDSVTIEKAIRAISPQNIGLDIPRAKIIARFIWNMTRTEIAQIEVVARAMAPNGEADGPYELYKLGDPVTP
ncbi:hypothetical protein LJC39_01845 [Parabacteroides sp. OttesenSCG-928-B22]|nr:hypothetical protein [Parabacteroides sp. OttesenSCG-928-B22]